jgi:hypothetical protein
MCGDSPPRLALLDEAEALALALDDRARQGRVLAQMAQVLATAVVAFVGAALVIVVLHKIWPAHA